MSKVEKLTSERKNFLEQLYSLIYLEFEDQKDNKEKDEYEKIRTISINATWGMGKSLFAEALEEHILNKNSEEFKIEVLKYNAWQNDCFSDPMKTIIGELNEQLTLSSELKEKAEIVLKNITKKGLKALFGIILKNFKMTDKDIENLKELFTGLNESSLAEYKEYKKMINDFKDALSEEAVIGTSFKPKVILVDELDRCRPDFAIEVLETIKHIFDVNNIIFVFLINKPQLKSSVSNIYGENFGNEDYFKKFFNLELNLPKLNYHEYKEIEYKNLEEESYEQFKPEEYKANLNNFNKNLFLDCLKNIPSEISPRERKLMFKKFDLILKTLPTNQKNNIILSLTLINYFIYREVKTNLDFEEWFYDLWFEPFKNENPLFEVDRNSIKRFKNINSSIDSFDGILRILYFNLLNNNSEPLDEDTNEISSYEIQPSKCSKYNLGLGECHSCTESCEEMFGKNNVLFNNKNILNLHCGFIIDKVENGIGSILYLPLEERYFENNTYIEVLMQWCKDKYNFVASVE